MKYLSLFSTFATLLLCACSYNITIDNKSVHQPTITPDYKEVTIPCNIAPIHFTMPDSCNVSCLHAIYHAGDMTYALDDKDGQIAPSAEIWHSLLKASDTLQVTLFAEANGQWTEYAPFDIYIKHDKIDPYITYRLIEPGYETWNEMGIYQRCLENFETNDVLTNKMTGYGCVNCHSFRKHNPDSMLFHLRVDYGGTYIITNGNIEKLNTKTPQTEYALVYPSWHPNGKYIAFSVNNTKQMFHTTDINRIEVMDFASNVVVYDIECHKIITSHKLFSPKAFETFPTFSPDGKTLYFCSADSVPMPNDYRDVKYSLCAIAFDTETRTFGDIVDTLYNARTNNKSVSFPRISPDGKHLMFTLSDYGNFSIWHKESDLYMVSLNNDSIFPLSTLNSNNVESYHSWSSNSRWVVFSSRRDNGLYTQPFIAYIDSCGNAHKPFLLPQEETGYYNSLMKSFNIPEFTLGKVSTSAKQISTKAKEDKGKDVSFGGFR